MWIIFYFYYTPWLTIPAKVPTCLLPVNKNPYLNIYISYRAKLPFQVSLRMASELHWKIHIKIASIPMSLHVFFTVEWCFECFLTVGTHIWSKVIMNPHVPPEATTSSEGPVAHNTLESFQSCVCSNMCFQNSSWHKTSSTLRALKWLFTSMRPL